MAQYDLPCYHYLSVVNHVRDAKGDHRYCGQKAEAGASSRSEATLAICNSVAVPFVLSFADL